MVFPDGTDAAALRWVWKDLGCETGVVEWHGRTGVCMFVAQVVVCRLACDPDSVHSLPVPVPSRRGMPQAAAGCHICKTVFA